MLTQSQATKDLSKCNCKDRVCYTENTVGFENHSGLTYIQGETKPLAMVEIGAGNNNEDKKRRRKI